MKSAIERLYRTMFNFFVKKDGYSRLSHYLASVFLLLLLIFVVGSLFLILNLISKDTISFHTSKSTVISACILVSFLNYLLLFSVLKFEKEGDLDNHLFELEQKKYQRTLKGVFAIIICFFALAGLDILRQFIEEYK